jgi:hypothetical protein
MSDYSDNAIKQELFMPPPNTVSMSAIEGLRRRQCRADPATYYNTGDLGEQARQAQLYNSTHVVFQGNRGGMNPESPPTADMPYYDPRGVTTAAIVTGGPFSTPLNIKHGPAEFTYTAADVKPKTQYVPEGNLITEPLTLCLTDAPCVCVRGVHGTIQQLFLTPVNAMKVRTLLVQAGVVVLTPDLERVNHRNACSCRILGGWGGAYQQFAEYASQFSTTSVMDLPQPVHFVNYANTAYVAQVLADLRASVNQASILNYLRTEGPRAYLPDRPIPGNANGNVVRTETVVMPSGAKLLASDTDYEARTFLDPRLNTRRLKLMSDLSGIPIDGRGVNHYVFEDEA